MNIRDLEYVVAVAEELHFGRAALKCHVSQPALSGQIRKLEEYLGVILFERTNRTVWITPIGVQIVAQARRLMTLSDEIIATAQSARDPFSGSLRMAMIATIGPYLSPLILPAIRHGLTDLALILSEGQTSDLETRLANGELDAAITATVPSDSGLTDIALFREPFRIALPAGHALAGQEAIDIGDVAHEDLLLLTDGHCLRDQVLDACHARAGPSSANTRETSLETLLALVAAGDGVTLVPALARPGDDGGQRSMVTRREATGTAGRTVRLVFRASFPRIELINRIAAIIRGSVPASVVGILE
jgi:LysR family hydrogen peroxide-inducible transcriptional activator